MTNFPKNLLNKSKRWYTSVRNIFRKSDGAKKADPNLALQQVVSARKRQGLPTKSQIKYFPQLLSKKEKQIASIAFVIIVITGILLGREFLNSQRLVVPAVGGEYTEGLVGAPQLINPLYSLTSDVDTDLTRLIYSGLMKYDTANGLVPDLAESYTISEDGKTYTFVIRDNAIWHDGEKVLADDIIFTINAIQNPDYRSPLAVSFTNVTVEQVNDRTVSFTLQEEFTPFLSFLTVGILPSHLWQEIAPFNASLAELDKKPIGSGPYIFEKLVRDSNGNLRNYELVRNPNFYGGAAYIEKITFKFYSDLASGVDSLNNHNIEGLSYVPINNLELFKKDSSFKMYFPQMHQYTALFINEDNNSILADNDVRRALATGTNKNQIIDNILLGHGLAIDTFILPGMLGENPDVTKYGYDLEAAKALLNDAGWTISNTTDEKVKVVEEETTNTSETETTDNIEDSTDTAEEAEMSLIRTKDGKTLELEIVTVDSAELVQTAEEIKAQWLELGVLANINIVSVTTLQSDILKNRNYDILLSGELYGIDTDPYAFWHSSQSDYPGLNLSQFANSEADDYIEAGRTTQDIEKRTKAYQELQNIVAEEIPAIFLYQPYYVYVTASKIKGVTIEQMVSPADRFSRINEWHIKTRKVFGKDEETEVIDEAEVIEEIDPAALYSN